MKQDFCSVLIFAERLHRRTQDRLRRELARLEFHGVEPGQAALVLAIGQEAISVGDLARRGAYEGVTLSYHLKRLQLAGYTIQERSAQDKRVHIVRLSDTGLRLLRTLTRLRDQSAAALGPLISQSDLKASERTLQLLEQFLRTEEEEQTSSVRPDPDEEVSPISTDVDRRAVQQDRLDVDAVRNALMAMSPEQREALILVRVEDLTYADAALVCGVAEGTMKSRVNRGRKRLAVLLQLRDDQP